MVTSHLGRPTEGAVQARGFAGAGGQAPGRAAAAARCRWWPTGSTASTCTPGEVVLLENCRLNKGEKKNDAALARRWPRCATSTCNDAFGTAHRAEATTYGIAQFAQGRLRRPAAGRGDRRHHQGAGATRSGRWWPSSPAPRCQTKLTILKSLAAKVDQLIVGGGIANTFMLAAGLPIGKSLAEPDLLDEAKAVIEAMRARGAAVPIPTDVVTAKTFAADAPADREGRATTWPTTT